MGRRGMWDEPKLYPSRSYRSQALEEGYENFHNGLSPPCRHEVDQGRSPDLFDSPPRHDSEYHTAVADRLDTRRASGRQKEQRSRSKRTKSEREDKADAKVSQTRHPPNSRQRRSDQKKERRLLVFTTSDSESETSDVHVYENVLRPDLLVIHEISPEVH